jgi:hypothetical protein
LWRSWGNLLHSIRTGEGAALFTFSVDAWTYRAEPSDERVVFDAAMTDLSLAEAEAILKACDFGRFGCVVDIGGGEGHLLKAILLACPSVRGILFDQQQVVESAEQVLAAPGLLDRCQAVGGDFFQVIPGGGDAYVMKSVLHDWDDGAAATILRNCRNAMPPAATLLVIERVVGPPMRTRTASSSTLNMLVQYGALERTRQEFEALFKRGGFDLINIVPTSSALRVLIAGQTAE